MHGPAITSPASGSVFQRGSPVLTSISHTLRSARPTQSDPSTSADAVRTVEPVGHVHARPYFV